MDEPVWSRAALLTGCSQLAPKNGIAVAGSTEVLVWYSLTAVHFGVRAFESHGEVRTTRAERDKIGSDAYVQFLPDAFKDGRPAMVFMVSPLGVQADAVLKETGQTSSAGGMGATQSRESADLSTDFVFQSKGRVTAWGTDPRRGLVPHMTPEVTDRADGRPRAGDGRWDDRRDGWNAGLGRHCVPLRRTQCACLGAAAAQRHVPASGVRPQAWRRHGRHPAQSAAEARVPGDARPVGAHHRREYLTESVLVRRDGGRTGYPLLHQRGRAWVPASAYSANSFRADWLVMYTPQPGTVFSVRTGGAPTLSGPLRRQLHLSTFRVVLGGRQHACRLMAYWA